jgi:hypothetical protein
MWCRSAGRRTKNCRAAATRQLLKQRADQRSTVPAAMGHQVEL